MLLVLWIDQLAAKQLEAGERALFVRTHQPAIAGNIGGKDSGELTFGLIWGHWGRVPQFLIYILPPNALPLRSFTGMARREIRTRRSGDCSRPEVVGREFCWEEPDCSVVIDNTLAIGRRRGRGGGGAPMLVRPVGRGEISPGCCYADPGNVDRI